MPPKNLPYPGKDKSFEDRKNKKAWAGKSPRVTTDPTGRIGTEYSSVAKKSVPNAMTAGTGAKSGGRSLFNGQGEAGMVENLRSRKTRKADKRPSEKK